MSQANRPVGDEFAVTIRALQRRVEKLERATTGQVFDIAGASSNLGLTTAFQDIPGCTLTITRPGRYLVIGSFRVQVSVAAAGFLFIGNISPSGHTTSLPAGGDTLLSLDTTVQTVICGFRAVTWQAPGSVKLQAEMSGGAGTASVLASGYTHIAAVRTGPA